MYYLMEYLKNNFRLHQIMKIKMIAAILFLTSVLFAQGSKTFTLRECVEIALENNHKHQQALLNKEKADKQVSEAYGSSVLPSIDGILTYNRAIKRGVFVIDSPGFSGTFEMGSLNTLTAAVNLEQPLFSGAMFLAVDIAKTYAEASQKAADYSEEELIMKVRESYYQYVLAHAFIRLSEFQIKRAEENLANTELKFKTGLIPEYDYIKANVQYQNLLPTKTEAETQLNLAYNNLKLVMGYNFDNKIEVADSIIFREIMTPEFEDGLKELNNKNDLIKQMELQSELQDLVVSYKWTEHLPKINAFGTWQTQSLSDDIPINDWDFFNSLFVGVNLKLPIFKGGTISNQVEQAEIDYKIAEEALLNTQKTVRKDYENTLLLIKKSKEQVKAYQIAIDEAERGYQISRKRFDAGLGTQLEVTDASASLISAQVNFLSSVYEYYVSHARLDKLLGKKLNQIEFN